MLVALLSAAICAFLFSYGSAFLFSYGNALKRNEERCVLCHDMRQAKEMEMLNFTENCERLDACDIDTTNCAQYCGLAAINGDPHNNGKAKPFTPIPRISKAFGTRGYDKIRVSVVTNANDKPPRLEQGYDYSQNFQYVWEDMALHTAIVDVQDEVDIFNIKVKVAKQGAGVAGLYFGDPCYSDYSSPITVIGCSFSKQWNTKERTPKILDAFLKHDDMDYWALLGDNWYDRTGRILRYVYSQLSPVSLSKLFVSVPGNHDFWNAGSPKLSTNFDQCGLGYIQYFPMDVKAGVANLSNPFNIENPFAAHYWGCNVPKAENFVWYHQLGNIGFFGYNGANDFNTTLPYFAEACQWFDEQPGLEVIMMVTHWDTPNLGCASEADGPHVFHIMSNMPGCKRFLDKNNFKFYTGHTHCNRPHPEADAGMGFQVAGQGMGQIGCEKGSYNYGFSVFDSTENRLRAWFFWLADASGGDNFDSVYNCINAQGWRKCTELARLWLDQPIDSSESPPSREHFTQIWE